MQSFFLQPCFLKKKAKVDAREGCNKRKVFRPLSLLIQINKNDNNNSNQNFLSEKKKT